MPAYEYHLQDRTGRRLGTFTAVMPVDQRDAVRVCRHGLSVTLERTTDGECLGMVRTRKRRVTVHRAELPRRVAISGAAQNPHDEAYQQQRGFYREEQRLGSDFERHATMSKAEIRRVMAMPEAPISND